MTRRAACSCGELVVTCVGEPVRVSMCHCRACQRRTGSVSGVQARFASEHVGVEGVSARYERVGDSGTRITFSFCPRCGSTVCWEMEALPGFVAVAVGAFADATFPAPTVSVYEARRPEWAALPDTIVHHRD